MSISNLSTEIIQKIYEYITIADLFHLAQTSKQNYRIYLGRHSHLLEQSMHNSFGPVRELYKLVVSNEPDKSKRPLGTEIRRNLVLNRLIGINETPKLTVEVLRKMAVYGRVANRWSEIYPQIQWRDTSENRRLLRPREREQLRGAIYRYWTYSTLFHDPVFTHFDPDFPRRQDDPRLRILRTYSTIELIQLTEFVDAIRQLLQIDLYPSNSVIRDCYSEPVPPKTLVALGWGSGTFHYRLVYDLMKYDPADILHLFDKTSSKKERLEYLMSRGISFADKPATLGDSIWMVMCERKVIFETIGDGHDEVSQYGIIDFPEKICRVVCMNRDRYTQDASLDGTFVDGPPPFLADRDAGNGGVSIL